MAADVEGADLELLVADGTHAEVELGEDAFAGFEPVAASSVEHEKAHVVGEDWRTKRLLVLCERDVARAHSELEVVDGREESGGLVADLLAYLEQPRDLETAHVDAESRRRLEGDFVLLGVEGTR